MLCNRGLTCKFAHSEAELCQWDQDKARSEHQPRVPAGVENGRFSAREIPTIRQLQEDSKPILCGYVPKCKRGDRCSRAHSVEERESWWAELSKRTRKYRPEHHSLKLCRVLEESEAKKACTNGARCRYAHSQRELSSWEEGLNVRPGAGKMMEMCRHSTTECQYYLDAGKCRYAHNDKELQVWKKGIL